MKNILDFLPISTDRLVLKQTDIFDIDLIMKMDKQEETQLYLGGVKNKTEAERVEFLKKKNKNGNSLTAYLNNIAIGFVGLKINGAGAEISYIFDSDFTGNGYCSEAVSKLIDVVFNQLNLEYIFAYSKSENIASKRVLEKHNFKVNGIKEDFIYYLLEK